MEQDLLLDEVIGYVKKLCGNDYKVIVETIEIENGLGYTGIIIKNNDEDLALAINWDVFSERYGDTLSAEELAESIYLQGTEPPDPMLDRISDYKDYEQAKGYITFRLVNYEWNRNLLEKIPHEKICDLAVIFYILNASVAGEMMITVSNTMLKDWGISMEELKEQAFRNCITLLPPCFISLDELIFGVGKRDMEVFPDRLPEQNGVPFYCLSNKNRTNGAAAILYPGILEKVADLLKSDLVILPSSRHEVLICPLGIKDLKKLRQVVQSVNIEAVNGEDVLSDNVYVFHRETAKLEAA